ncbi:putative isochorismatase family protein yrdC [Sugiyamaella lignohabitans]|uniref:Putative isochorismatase family protein yrdC n=1 Tax=Sugiyamaella lignohabitans TaxID=796027 RepID=A0A167D4V6_9ASCO|nr:putative isochorismatase family protein yrdC [Sugiyamaella lignohabitans]ANB12481.1 putative isochorismatase family protein yrdC [Sugiyamaella lignohabitans]
MSVKSLNELVGQGPDSASVKESVLVIIDAQNEYADGLLKTANVESTRKQIASLLEKYRAGKSDIVHVIHKVPEGAPIFTPGTPLEEEFSELKPVGNEKVVYKEHPGSFTGTDLGEFLESTGKKKLVLTGYMAHVCVSTTTRQAAEREYSVLLPKDAIGDRDIPGVSAQQLVDVALAELADAFGTVTTSADIN